MSIEAILDAAFRTAGQTFQIGQVFGNEGSVEYILDAATGVFSFILFAVTIYAWLRRSRQLTLLIVAFGFLTFFVVQAVEIVPYPALHGELFRSIMEFVTLTLFFIALVVRPQRSVQKQKKFETEHDK